MRQQKTSPKGIADHPLMLSPRDRIIADIMRRKEAEVRCQEIAAEIARRNGRRS